MVKRKREISKEEVAEEEYIVEKVLESVEAEGGGVLFRVKWFGYPDEANTWEPISSFNGLELIHKFYEDHPRSFGWKRFAKKKTTKKRKSRKSTLQSVKSEDESSPDESRSSITGIQVKTRTTAPTASQNSPSQSQSQEGNSESGQLLQQNSSQWIRRVFTGHLTEQKKDKGNVKHPKQKRLHISESEEDELDDTPTIQSINVDKVKISHGQQINSDLVRPISESAKVKGQRQVNSIMDTDGDEMDVDVEDEGKSVEGTHAAPHLDPISFETGIVDLAPPAPLIPPSSRQPSAVAPSHSPAQSSRSIIMRSTAPIHDPEVESFNRSLTQQNQQRTEVVKNVLKSQRRTITIALNAFGWWVDPIALVHKRGMSGGKQRACLKVWWGMPDDIDHLLKVKSITGSGGKGCIFAGRSEFPISDWLVEVDRIAKTPDNDRWKLKQQMTSARAVWTDVLALIWFLKGDELMASDPKTMVDPKSRAFEFSDELETDTDCVFIHVTELEDEENARNLLYKIENMENGRIRKNGYVCFFGSGKDKQRIWKRIWDGGIAVTFTHSAILNHLGVFRSFLGGVGMSKHIKTAKSMRPTYLLYPFLHPGLLAKDAPFALTSSPSSDPWLGHHTHIPAARCILSDALEGFLPNNRSTVSSLETSLYLVNQPLKHEDVSDILSNYCDWFPNDHDRIFNVQDIQNYDLDPLVEKSEYVIDSMIELARLSRLIKHFKERYLNVRRWVIIISDSEIEKAQVLARNHHYVEFMSWSSFNGTFIDGNGLAWL